DILSIFKEDERIYVNDEYIIGKIQELALKYDEKLISIILNSAEMKVHFFTEVGGALIFKREEFIEFIGGKYYLEDSYTKYRNKIGLAVNNSYIKENRDIVLNWAYKDCVLEGGQDREDLKRKEVFYNEILASDDIDKLLDKKVITNFKKYESGKENTVNNLDGNILIKGNNLITLNILKNKYKGGIKLIYIDPPYNTEKDSFRYNDKFTHSSWLTFMKNRLTVAKELLKEDGVIFISIDDKEQAYLKVLCDEIFGRDNYVGEIIWETATDNNATQISIEHEYILCYSKNKTLLGKWEVESTKSKYIIDKYNELVEKYGKENCNEIQKELRGWIKANKKSNSLDLSGVSHYNYVDEKGVYYPGNSSNTKPGDYLYDIIHPETGGVCKKPANGYRWPKSTFDEANERGDVEWGKDENTIPKIKKRIETAKELFKSYYYEDNRNTTKELTNLMGEKVFDNPKSINLLKKIIKFTTDENDIILDFFAGSGSTAEAVLEYCKETGEKRRFILAEQMDYILDITLNRINKVSEKLNYGDVIYCELMKWNEVFISQINSASESDELINTWNEIKEKAFLSYRVKVNQIDKSIDEFKELSLEQQKELLLEILDKNHLYVNLSEIDDTTYNVSDEDKKLNKEFYGLK
ncbi:DNA methyltransferase, partial [Paraclostridium bifermentans]|uniref:DNA methyltransferase n=1 Tax=Paraclostridium bifermentans TaxID=1490 RepID=UPI00242DE410